MQDMVVFKGNRGGIQLFLADTDNMEALFKELAEKLANASQFFLAGTRLQVKIPSSWRDEAVEQEKLTQLLAKYELQWEPFEETEEKSLQAETLYVTRTLRSGQEIRHEGDIEITGDVNPGAVVVAGGNIRIVGACRGVVHAGFPSDRSAHIIADRLMASQIRIADLIARAPDEVLEQPKQTEMARIENEIVVIAPIEQEED
ncbi:septum site-determining protein MinC [Anaeromusa acidaminophila]|uniref:septum site-determining protein MinC n=1 Tax=Anaeromusa acidaminophila TaxID=81464 RepID=UPI00037AA380|nr:septum site-determining protein MinC [Anaeromusa acidaminophila]